MSATKRHVTDEQINFVVRGFVQVWNKFEDALAKELAARNGSEKLGGKDTQLTAIHAMLFRVGTGFASNGSMTMGELSATLSVPLSTATRVVDLLVKAGYVQRLQDPDDRRVVRVAFTDHGKESYRIMDDYINDRIRQIAVYLQEDELDTLLELLNKVAVAIKEISK
jgi:DNA-binding MarR family transcriptional regulator